MARTSTFRGNAATDSMKERSRANPCAPSRERALSSGTSVSKSEVTSMTAAPASETVSTSNARMMVSLFAAPTARAMGRSGSATMAYETLFRNTCSCRRSHFTTRLPSG